MMSEIDTSIPPPAGLVKELSGNCKAAEELAIETVTANDAPLFNAFRELTRGDCLKIMKRQDMFGVLEQAIVLSGLTDYMTCAYQSNLFDTFSRKQDREQFSSVLSLLNNKWTRFFQKLGAYDLSYTQLNSMISVLRRSFKRLPGNMFTFYMMETMIMGQNTLERARLQSCRNITQFVEVKDKQPLKVSVNNGQSNSSIKTMNGIIVISQTSSASKNKSQKDSECKENKATVKSAPKPPQSQKRTLDFSKAPVIDLTSEPAVKIQRKKYNADITRYILKPTENKEKRPDSASEIKSKEEENKTSSGMEVDCKIKDIINLATPTGKLKSGIGAESPIKKIENKMNAFEEMMKCSRAIKGRSIKRKSLFQ